MTSVALFAALLAICSWLSIPAGDIAFTLQTFGVFLCLFLLGGKWGRAAIAVYLLLGAVGLPVFSGFRGGPGILLGITGGYLWGFLPAALIYRLLERRGPLPAAAAAQLCCYLFGTLWFALWSGGEVGAAAVRCVLPFLLPDGVKLLLALRLSRRLKKHIPFISDSPSAA